MVYQEPDRIYLVKKLNEIIVLLNNFYYKNIKLDDIQLNQFVCIEQFLKYIHKYYLDNNPHFEFMYNSNKNINQYPICIINKYKNAYIYIPDYDFLLDDLTCIAISKLINYMNSIYDYIFSNNSKKIIIDLRLNESSVIIFILLLPLLFLSKGIEKYLGLEFIDNKDRLVDHLDFY